MILYAITEHSLYLHGNIRILLGIYIMNLIMRHIYSCNHHFTFIPVSVYSSNDALAIK